MARWRSWRGKTFSRLLSEFPVSCCRAWDTVDCFPIYFPLEFYHFPVQLAAQIAVRTVTDFLKEHPDQLDIVMWVLFDERTENIYQLEVKKYGVGK